MPRVNGGVLAALGVSALAIPLVAHMVTRGHKSSKPAPQVSTTVTSAEYAKPAAAPPPAAAPSSPTATAAANKPDCGKPAKRDRYAVVVRKTTPTKDHDATKVITNRPPPRPCP